MQILQILLIAKSLGISYHLPSVSSVSSRPVNIVSANFTIMSTPFNAFLDILPFSLPQLPLPRMPQKRQLNWMVYQTFLEPQVPRLRRVSVS